MGMTMKRAEKATHQETLANVSRNGKVNAEFASPKLIAEHGLRMTPADYREHRMGRGTRDAETAKEIKASHTRYPRITTRKG